MPLDGKLLYPKAESGTEQHKEATSIERSIVR